MKPVPHRDFSLRFVEDKWEQDADVREHYDGIYTLVLNEMVHVVVVPEIADRARSWPPTPLDEVAGVREARLDVIVRSRYAIVADAAAAGTVDQLPATHDEIGDREVAGAAVFFVSNARQQAFAAEIRQALDVTRDRRSWIDYASLEVVRFARHVVLEAPIASSDRIHWIAGEGFVEPRPELTCPRCGSHRVRGGKAGFPDGALHDRWCSVCGLLEDRVSTAADFDAWQRRWETQS